MRFLRDHFTKLGMWPAFTNLVSGYVDNLRVFRDVFPRKKSYKLNDLAFELTAQPIYDEHEALDLSRLQFLLLHLRPQP